MIRDYVLNVLQREYTFKPDAAIDEIDFVKEGYMSSLAIIQFIVELEDEFGVEFTEEELSDPAFHVVGKLIELIEKKTSKV